jgi:hypothetical protein
MISGDKMLNRVRLERRWVTRRPVCSHDRLTLGLCLDNADTWTAHVWTAISCPTESSVP